MQSPLAVPKINFSLVNSYIIPVGIRVISIHRNRAYRCGSYVRATSELKPSAPIVSVARSDMVFDSAVWPKLHIRTRYYGVRSKQESAPAPLHPPSLQLG